MTRALGSALLPASGALVLAVALACSGSETSGEGDDDDAGAGPGVCAPGSTRLCAGPGSCQGAEVCVADGSGYGPCDCGGSSGGTAGLGGSTSGGSTAGGVAGAMQGGSTSTGGSTSSGGSGGSPARVFKVCLKACSTANDCGSGTPADGPANYTCPDGGCIPAGCQNDAECNAQRAGTVCRLSPGASYKVCNFACTSAAQCGDTTGASQLYGSDNYSCDDGICVYRGCNADAECQADLQSPTSFCSDAFSYPSCASPCQMPVDCTVPMAPTLQDVDNYECVEGACSWIGCLNDAECAIIPGSVCRPI